jgi:hypothetical protein
MDRELRIALRDYAAGRIEQAQALAMLDRAGASRATRWAMVDAGLRKAFIELLDFDRVDFDRVFYVAAHAPDAADAADAAAAASDEDEEQRRALALSSQWHALRRRSNDATLVRVWFPSRYEMLETGDVSDTRITVSAPLRERSEILETLIETMPWATIVSAQVSHGRPERMPKQQPKEEAEWPAESNRAPVRG